jgi:hypothetical protein
MTVSRGFASGNGAIAVCDRCKQKYRYNDLVKDLAMPGLWVCKTCQDGPNPWVNWKPRLVPIVLDHPRPDQIVPMSYLKIVDGKPRLYVVQEDGKAALVQTQEGQLDMEDYQVEYKTAQQTINQYIPPHLRYRGNGLPPDGLPHGFPDIDDKESEGEG